jgi:pilus assembly protein CpaB
MIVRVVLLLLGLASGGLLAAAAFYGVFGSSTPKPSAAAAMPIPQKPQNMVVVATRAIPTGTLITYQDLRFAAVSDDKQTAGDYMRPHPPEDKDQLAADTKVFHEIAGSVARSRFDEGAPIERGKTVKPGDAGFLAAVLRPGMRAITMQVTMVTGDNGLLAAGDHVDVVLTQVFAGHEVDPANRAASETIARDLRVIAVDQHLQAGPEPQKDMHPAQTVTLEVSALQAEQVDVGAKMGDLALAIRGVQSEPAGPPPPTVWAKDISQAAAEVKPAVHVIVSGKGPKGGPGGPDDGSGPRVRIMHGDKVESVVLP